MQQLLLSTSSSLLPVDILPEDVMAMCLNCIYFGDVFRYIRTSKWFKVVCEKALLHVKSFSFSRKREYSRRSIRCLTVNCRNVKHVSFEANALAIDEITKVLSGLPKLNSVEYSDTSSSVVQSSFKCLPADLQHLKIRAQMQLSLKVIAERCSNLQSLTFQYYSHYHNCNILAILENCVQLRVLKLRYFCKIGGAVALCRSCLPKMHTLELPCCEVRSANLSHLNRVMPNLKALRLSFNLNICDRAIRSLRRLHLEELIIPHCGGDVTEQTVRFLCENHVLTAYLKKLQLPPRLAGLARERWESQRKGREVI